MKPEVIAELRRWYDQAQRDRKVGGFKNRMKFSQVNNEGWMTFGSIAMVEFSRNFWNHAEEILKALEKRSD